jgi:hypothetical protein
MPGRALRLAGAWRSCGFSPASRRSAKLAGVTVRCGENGWRFVGAFALIGIAVNRALITPPRSARSGAMRPLDRFPAIRAKDDRTSRPLRNM